MPGEIAPNGLIDIPFILTKFNFIRFRLQEEYANMDDIGMLRACGHDFHVGCIKKWLSMKNLCPICKTEPMKQK